MQTLFDLRDQIAVVTGGSSGIGKSIAAALAVAGAKVVLVARRKAQLKTAVEEITAAGGRASLFAADLSDNNLNYEELAAKLASKFGAPHILFNCAGVNLREPYEAISPASWDVTLRLNLSVPFFLARALVSGMIKNGHGKVVNIASLQSKRAFPNSMAYGASKGGVMQLTRAMAEAWSKYAISCNAIAPGFFPTELTTPVFCDPEREAWAAGQTAIGRNGELQDLDGVAIFLASKASDYITGQTLFVDGGFTAK
ncbi:MAG: SDR family oxidoreductase [Arenicellales bacterium WSBS_2016_MAG_OTU3]